MTDKICSCGHSHTWHGKSGCLYPVQKGTYVVHCTCMQPDELTYTLSEELYEKIKHELYDGWTEPAARLERIKGIFRNIKANTPPIPSKDEQDYENDYDDHSRGY